MGLTDDLASSKMSGFVTTLTTGRTMSDLSTLILKEEKNIQKAVLSHFNFMTIRHGDISASFSFAGIGCEVPEGVWGNVSVIANTNDIGRFLTDDLIDENSIKVLLATRTQQGIYYHIRFNLLYEVATGKLHR